MLSFFFTKSISASAEEIKDLMKSFSKLSFIYSCRIFSLLTDRLYNKLIQLYYVQAEFHNYSYYEQVVNLLLILKRHFHTYYIIMKQ